MSNYIGFQGELNGVGYVEMEYYIEKAFCDFPGCSTLLIWYNPGNEDAGDCFVPYDKNCACEPDYPPRCCSSHKPVYVCQTCADV